MYAVDMDGWLTVLRPARKYSGTLVPEELYLVLIVDESVATHAVR
jgi:hypothetical protein